MIAALLSRAAAPLFKAGLVLAVAGGLALAAALVGLKAADRLTAVIVDRVAAAVSARDAHWQSEIAKANLKVAQAQAALANEAMKMNGELAAARETARTAQEELEKANAALPDGDRHGLDAGRVRLLNRR